MTEGERTVEVIETQAGRKYVTKEAGHVVSEVLVPLANFEVKDSGERQKFSSGMQRDVTTGKVRYDLVFDGPMLVRYAAHLTKGAEKYEPRNWMKATGDEELDRFRQSAVRHFVQWLNGCLDEDHAAATWFNINGFEFLKEKMRAPLPDRESSQPGSTEAGEQTSR